MTSRLCECFFFVFLPDLLTILCWLCDFLTFRPPAACCLQLAVASFSGALLIKALLPHWGRFFFFFFFCHPPPPPPPLLLVRVDQYFPCSLSLMWNWLFVQTLLRLHKDLDEGGGIEPKCNHVSPHEHAATDAPLDF